MNEYEKMKKTLNNFLTEFKKEGTELAPNETLVGQGDGDGQGAAGKAMSDDIKANIPAGTATGGGQTTSSIASPETGIVNPQTVKKSETPGDDMAILENESIKKASAAQVRFEVGVLNMIDRMFNEQASKTASDNQSGASNVEESAKAWRKYHISQIKGAFGCSWKEASELVDQLAEEDPAAVMPPEAMSGQEADDILAAAAEGDAASADGGDGGDGGAEDEEAVAALTETVEMLQEQGHSQEEVMQIIMDETGLTPEDLMDTVVEDLRAQGLGDEDIAGIADEVEAMQADGVTPEELAEMLSQQGAGQE